MKNIRFFDSEEEEFELPTKDFMDEMKIARLEYGYIDSRYYDDTYDQTMIMAHTGCVEKGNNSEIFLNPKAIREGDAVEAITHETLHLVIWKFEKNCDSERIIRKILNKPSSLSWLGFA